MSKPLLTFVHISDSHIGSTPDFTLHHLAPLPCLQQLVTVINDLPQAPDFVLHTGDISEDGSPGSYELAAAALARLRIPVYYVNGNHDSRALVRQSLGAPPHPSGDADAPLDYAFEVRGERFLVLDACSDAVADPLGRLSSTQLALVRAEAVADGPPLTIVLHYSPFKMASPWLDANMILVNGEALHEALLPARDRLRGVFHGHLHRSSQVIRDGIAYTCAGSVFLQYGWRPWDEKPQVDYDYPPAYNIVQYFRNQVIVHQYAFSCAGEGR